MKNKGNASSVVATAVGMATNTEPISTGERESLANQSAWEELPVLFCSVLIRGRAVNQRLIDPSGSRLNGKHMASLHSTQKQLLEPSFPMEKFYRTSR
ncbi:hypothetical protein EYF80_037251 [Liparis tanakae]|uniref:Uncharacterized protein n=1 Tax=Liparis tanakae TaxID=230148 RepID=A0A4Z2GIF8_9TELE|nr:hypothetical protein EYF80_037251 [Liparis tanakae]